jgi:mRNA-degrading endonuclease RelE of RelBE toxin-antitoxin system
MKWELLIANPARRAVRDMSRDDGKQILDAFEEMRTDPYAGDIKFLKGTDRALRRRVGSWRIMYEVHAERRIVVIGDVVRRDSNTY